MLCLLSERPTASLQPGANVTLNDCLRAGLMPVSQTIRLLRQLDSLLVA